MSGIHHAARLVPGGHDMLQGWGTFVMVLVGIHVAALLFWLIMLVLNPSSSNKSDDKRD